jgi:thiol-disulfide isomerase/thioredoxin
VPAAAPGIASPTAVLHTHVATGLIVLVIVLALASAFGVWRKRTDGRVRLRPVAADGESTPIPGIEQRDTPETRSQDPARDEQPVLTADRLGRDLGERATLVQFSSAFCQPCRAAKVLLADVAAKVDGVEHIEIDAESHLDLVREIGILRTPTTLVLDRAGRITARASGVPRKDQVLAALDATVR